MLKRSSLIGRGVLWEKKNGLPGLRKSGKTEPGKSQPHGDPLLVCKFCSHSTKSSSPLLTMEQDFLGAAQLLQNEEHFLEFWAEGKQFPPIVNPPLGNEKAHLCFNGQPGSFTQFTLVVPNNFPLFFWLWYRLGLSLRKNYHGQHPVPGADRNNPSIVQGSLFQGTPFTVVLQ